MELEAQRLARHLAAGLQLSPGEEEWLGALPRPVQDAVRAQWRAASRYLPKAVRRLRAAEARAAPAAAEALMKGEKRKRIEPTEWSEALARWEKHTPSDPNTPHAYDRPSRISTILPPAQVQGAAKITAAVAGAAGVTTPTIRAWAAELRDVLDDADAEGTAAAWQEAGLNVTEKDFKRRAHRRRRPPGRRLSEK